jgi:hypothetical protein
MSEDIRGSYEKINYSIRPAKNIERKMMAQAFSKLTPFGNLELYRYVGFGSTFFSDFKTFHKLLGITNMVSIERDKKYEQRFIFNCPYKFVKIDLGESNDVLPQMLWDIRSLVWLDYDGLLDSSVITDIRHVCAEAPSGSMIIISVNAQPDRVESVQDELRSEKRLELLAKRVGVDRIPLGLNGKELREWGMARVCRSIIIGQIEETLVARNRKASKGNQMLFQQLFNFHYQDGAKMLTVGGILFDEGHQPQLAQCGFDQCEFVRKGEDSYVIDVPSLTLREIRFLESQVPIVDSTGFADQGLTSSDVEKFARLYRHFPTFTEAEL